MKPMQANASNPQHPQANSGFTLIEMLVVIAIMSVLMTAGSIGLSNTGGKGVNSGVSSAESLFDEARTIALGRRDRVRVLVAKDLTNSPGENLRRILIASIKQDESGVAKEDQWEVTSRGVLLPDQVYFSEVFSKKSQDSSGTVAVMPALSGAKNALAGSYYYYEFNGEGICTSPGASFVIGIGTRGLDAQSLKNKPRVTAAGKKDFGGFVVWRGGETSVFRSPEQISTDIKTLSSGKEF
jgi:prepilin-type N-terminal cleavage/methylation domain-containing protein